MVTRIKNLDSVHGDRLTALLRRLEPADGIGAYIQAVGFMPWGRKFKLRHDDTILRNFMALPLRDIEFLLVILNFCYATSLLKLPCVVMDLRPETLVAH